MRTVARALSVLECFSETEPSLPLHLIAARIGLSKATSFRLVNCLVDLGYLVRLSNHEYCLSLKLLHLAGRVKSTLGIRDVAGDTMRRLARTTDETIGLMARDGPDRLCIDVINSGHRVLSLVKTGDRAPLGLGASGKVLMAYLPQRELIPLLAKVARRRRLAVAELKQELALIRARGYALSISELSAGNAAAAVPVVEPDGQVRYSISLFCPTFRFEPRQQEFVGLMLEAGAEISQRFGARLPELVPAG
ncbi:MAG: IclR family transcriptional regulator [Alphaproteobacteria bacterium]|nr:IclR family transcriptional regulator [Alphaproteobacteria bacterium]